MDSQIKFSSILGYEYLEELEDLLFFNPQQRRALSGINHSISEYGVPNIITDRGCLRIKVDSLPESQTLYALDFSLEKPVLAGVMVYVRSDVENIVLLHIAVKEDYSRTGKHANKILVFRLLTQLRLIAKRIKGVRAITLKYSSGPAMPI